MLDRLGPSGSCLVLVLMNVVCDWFSGDDFYTCMSMERRGVNVMEFQLGVQTSSNFNQSLCHNEKFTPAWVTQGSTYSIVFVDFIFNS